MSIWIGMKHKIKNESKHVYLKWWTKNFLKSKTKNLCYSSIQRLPEAFNFLEGVFSQAQKFQQGKLVGINKHLWGRKKNRQHDQFWAKLLAIFDK